MDGFVPDPKVAFFEITGLDGYHIGMDHNSYHLSIEGSNIILSLHYFVLDNLSVPSISYEFLGLTHSILWPFTNFPKGVPKGTKDCSSCLDSIISD